MDYKVIFGSLAVIIGFASYLPYFRDVILRKTKPHAFTWFVWSLLFGITFTASTISGGASGTWVLGVGAVLNGAIFVMALFRGEKEITRLDVGSLIAALVGIGVLVITSNPLGAVIISALVDTIGFIPTFRKAYNKPHEETVATFLMGALAFLLSLFALQSVNLTTVIYPATLMVTNLLFSTMVIIRRGGKRR